MGQKILTLDTLEPDRDFIAINKKPYYLRAEEELSLLDIARIRRLSKTLNLKGLAEEATEEDVREIDRFADEILALILVDMPQEIVGKFTTAQKFLIVQAFTTAATARRAGAAGKTESPLTAGNSLPDSNGSTGADSGIG